MTTIRLLVKNVILVLVFAAFFTSVMNSVATNRHRQNARSRGCASERTRAYKATIPTVQHHVAGSIET